MQIEWITIERIICEQLGCDPHEVVLETTWDKLGADSLDLVELTMAFETEFNLDIPDETAAKWNCVADALNHFGAVAGHAYLFPSVIVKDARALTAEQVRAMT